MARRQAHPVPLNLTPELNLDALPCYGTAEQFCQIGSYYFGPVAARSILESWGLRWYKFNGRKVAATREFIAEARRRFGS